MVLDLVDIINNGIWNILVASGVFALPFVAIVIQEWLKARSEGADDAIEEEVTPC